MRDLVGETATTPDIDLLHGAAVLLDDIEEGLERGSDSALLEIGVEDDHDFVSAHAVADLLWTQGLRSLRSRRWGVNPGGPRWGLEEITPWGADRLIRPQP